TVTLMAGFASTLCYPLADALADAYGWRAAVQIFAGGAALIAVPLFALAAGMMERAAPAERPTAADNAAAAKRAFRRPVFWLLVVAFPLMAAIHGMFTSHILPLLQDRGASSAGAVFAASLIGPAQVAARILMTIGARNLSAVAISGLCFLGMALAAAVLWIAGAAGVGVFVFVALMGGAAGVTSIVRPLTAQDLLGRDGFGGISGALATPYIAMSAAAPILAALLWSAGGYELMLLAAFIAAIIGGGLIAISPRAAAIDPTTRTG
ncbi:MAG: MFS transporter, partial [Pseudomonadota bacterium]